MKVYEHPLRPGVVISANRHYQLRHQLAGLCVDCPQPLTAGSKVRCAVCLVFHRERVRLAMREKTGFKPWVPGGPGRPPMDRSARILAGVQ